MKTFKLLLISLSLVVTLSSCDLLTGSGSPTQTTDAAVTLQANPTQAQTIISTMPTVIASPMSTPFPPNTPVWFAYNYTCKLVAGGGNMTMNLAWIDRSNSEEGYNVYRDGQIIATLAPNSTFYVDVVFVATGKTLSYSVEAFNKSWHASSSTITYGCQ